MNNNLFYHMQEYKEKNKGSIGYVRLLHAVPNAPNVDIYIDNTLFVNDLAYGEYNDYLPLPVGKYRISLYVAGTINEPVISNSITINEDSFMTVSVIGMLDSIEFAGSEDAEIPMIQDKAMIRVAHLSPDAPAVDITLPDGTILFGDVSFKEVTPYLDASPMMYTLEVRVAGTSTVVLTIPDVYLDANQYYTVYAIGLVNDDPQLEALLLMDGK